VELWPRNLVSQRCHNFLGERYGHQYCGQAEGNFQAFQQADTNHKIRYGVGNLSGGREIARLLLEICLVGTLGRGSTYLYLQDLFGARGGGGQVWILMLLAPSAPPLPQSQLPC